MCNIFCEREYYNKAVLPTSFDINYSVIQYLQWGTLHKLYTEIMCHESKLNVILIFGEDSNSK